MNDLYQLLLLQESSKIDHYPSFRCMIQAYSRFQPNGPKALAILEAWNQVWMGDMERSPTRADYHSVLEAYAVAREDDHVLEGSQVALEIVQQLDQWGFTMRPNLLSQSLAVCCVSNVFFHVDNSHELGALHQEFQNVVLKRLVDELENATTTEFESEENVHWATMALGSVIQYYAECHALVREEDVVSFLSSGLIQLWVSLSHTYSIKWNETQSASFVNKQRWQEHVGTATISFFKLIEKTSTDQVLLDRKTTFQVMNDALRLVEEVNVSPLHTEHYYRAIKAAKRSNCADEELMSDWVQRMQTNHSEFSQEESIGSSEQTKSWNCLMMAFHELEQYDEVLRIWQTWGRSSRVRKDSISFATILKSLAKEGTFKAAEKAHSIWKKMVSAEPTKRYIHPTSQHYAHVMSAWSNTRDPRAHAFCQEVMDHLLEESIYNTDLQPGLSHYTSLIGSQGWNRRDAESRKSVFKAINELLESNFELDMQAYRACFAALSRTQSTDGARIAQEMLNQCLKKSLKPDARCFQAVMRGWAESQSSKALEYCENLIVQLESIYEASGKQSAFRPNSHCYVSMIMAAMYSSEKSGPTAESILNRMLDASERNMSDEPDKAVYSAVMKAYANDGSVENVERIFRRMETAFNEGNFRAAPDARSGAILMHAWAKSEDPEKAFRSRQLLMDMLGEFEGGNLDMMPTIQCFNAALNSCAFSESNRPEVKTEIVRVAIETMADMEKCHGEASEYAFRQIFHIIGRFVDDKVERLDLAAAFFQKCCQAGYVSEHIVRIIKSRIPELYCKIPGDDPSRLPSKWTRRISQS